MYCKSLEILKQTISTYAIVHYNEMFVYSKLPIKLLTIHNIRKANTKRTSTYSFERMKQICDK